MSGSSSHRSLREEGIGFKEMEEPKNTRGLLNKQLRLEDNPYFWDIRIFIIQLLQSRQQSLEIRLILLGLFLQKIGQLKEKEFKLELPMIMQDYLNRLDNRSFITSLENIKGNLNFKFNIARELIRYRMSGGGASEKYLTILHQLLEGLNLEEDDEHQLQDIEQSISKYQAAYENLYEPFMQKHEYMLENYVVNYIFKSLFPCDYKSLFESYMMLVIHFTLIKLHLIGMSVKQQKLTQEMVIECVQQLAKMIEHNSSYLQGVREGMESAGYNTMAYMFVMIKS